MTLMAMLTLIKDDLKGRTPRVSSRKSRPHMTNEDFLFIVWCWSRGLPSNTIARGVKCTHQIVVDYRRLVYKEPYRVFELPVMVKRSERKYLCRFCGGVEPSEIGCKRHILKHFMPLEYAKQVSLKPPDY